ncbi:hypothetical protein LRP52_43970 [Photobacterium sp. ZSDE20]|uniref:Fibronectin type-III domain-containing protein n=1 Tax=Photobacterium pectinilyticum TaxID=2906793 RepID=A0ABT1N923_9GAMM|nr:hypothetical protein [Photobacterium sp. ZSDE20]MCQ1061037.1 hypothetical protein [Photobacterium sp. ZSDE20]MDD1829129.1 hypothetical protein [Photobacterium sp. ZSDE20]
MRNHIKLFAVSAFVLAGCGGDSDSATDPLPPEVSHRLSVNIKSESNSWVSIKELNNELEEFVEQGSFTFSHDFKHNDPYKITARSGDVKEVCVVTPDEGNIISNTSVSVECSSPPSRDMIPSIRSISAYGDDSVLLRWHGKAGHISENTYYVYASPSSDGKSHSRNLVATLTGLNTPEHVIEGLSVDQNYVFEVDAVINGERFEGNSAPFQVPEPPVLAEDLTYIDMDELQDRFIFSYNRDRDLLEVTALNEGDDPEELLHQVLLASDPLIEQTGAPFFELESIESRSAQSYGSTRVKQVVFYFVKKPIEWIIKDGRTEFYYEHIPDSSDPSALRGRDWDIGFGNYSFDYRYTVKGSLVVANSSLTDETYIHHSGVSTFGTDFTANIKLSMNGQDKYRATIYEMKTKEIPITHPALYRVNRKARIPLKVDFGLYTEAKVPNQSQATVGLQTRFVAEIPSDVRFDVVNGELHTTVKPLQISNGDFDFTNAHLSLSGETELSLTSVQAELKFSIPYVFEVGGDAGIYSGTKLEAIADTNSTSFSVNEFTVKAGPTCKSKGKLTFWKLSIAEGDHDFCVPLQDVIYKQASLDSEYAESLTANTPFDLTLVISDDEYTELDMDSIQWSTPNGNLSLENPNSQTVTITAFEEGIHTFSVSIDHATLGAALRKAHTFDVLVGKSICPTDDNIRRDMGYVAGDIIKDADGEICTAILERKHDGGGKYTAQKIVYDNNLIQTRETYFANPPHSVSYHEQFTTVQNPVTSLRESYPSYTELYNEQSVLLEYNHHGYRIMSNGNLITQREGDYYTFVPSSELEVRGTYKIFERQNDVFDSIRVGQQEERSNKLNYYRYDVFSYSPLRCEIPRRLSSENLSTEKYSGEQTNLYEYTTVTNRENGCQEATVIYHKEIRHSEDELDRTTEYTKPILTDRIGVDFASPILFYTTYSSEYPTSTHNRYYNYREMDTLTSTLPLFNKSITSGGYFRKHDDPYYDDTYLNMPTYALHERESNGKVIWREDEHLAMLRGRDSLLVYPVSYKHEREFDSGTVLHRFEEYNADPDDPYGVIGKTQELYNITGGKTENRSIQELIVDRENTEPDDRLSIYRYLQHGSSIAFRDGEDTQCLTSFYENGVRNGSYEVLIPCLSHRFNERGFYVDGKRHGYHETWLDNPNCSEDYTKSNYDHGSLHGQRTRAHCNGSTRHKTVDHWNSGLAHGWSHHYVNGVLDQKCLYQNGNFVRCDDI